MEFLDEFLANAGEIKTRFFVDFGFKMSSIKSNNGELNVKTHYNMLLNEKHDNVIFEINGEMLDPPTELNTIVLQLKLANELTKTEALQLKINQMNNILKFAKMFEDEEE